MKTISFLVLVVLGLSTNGCCLKEPRVEPAYPQSVSGWKERRERGVRIRGEFVLKKGTSTDNGKIQVKIIDLVPPDPCACASGVTGPITIWYLRTRWANRSRRRGITNFGGTCLTGLDCRKNERKCDPMTRGIQWRRCYYFNEHRRRWCPQQIQNASKLFDIV